MTQIGDHLTVVAVPTTIFHEKGTNVIARMKDGKVLLFDRQDPNSYKIEPYEVVTIEVIQMHENFNIVKFLKKEDPPGTRDPLESEETLTELARKREDTEITPEITTKITPVKKKSRVTRQRLVQAISSFLRDDLVFTHRDLAEALNADINKIAEHMGRFRATKDFRDLDILVKNRAGKKNSYAYVPVEESDWQ